MKNKMNNIKKLLKFNNKQINIKMFGITSKNNKII